MSNFRQELIKLGATNPELRPHIRPLLTTDHKAGSDRFPMFMRNMMKELTEAAALEDDKARLLRVGFALHIAASALTEMGVESNTQLAKVVQQAGQKLMDAAQS